MPLTQSGKCRGLGPGPKEHRNAPGTRGHSTRTVSTVPCLMKDASKRAYVSQKLKMMPIYPPRRHGDHGERQFESEDYLMWVVLCHRGHRGNRDGATAVGGLRPPSFLVITGLAFAQRRRDAEPEKSKTGKSQGRRDLRIVLRSCLPSFRPSCLPSPAPPRFRASWFCLWLRTQPEAGLRVCG